MLQWLRTLIVVALAACAVALLLFGKSTHRAAVPEGRIVVEYWEKWTGNEEAQMRSIVDSFNETVGREKNIYVRYFSTSAVDQKTLVATAAGTPPDIAGVWDWNVTKFAALDALLPLDDLAREHGITEAYYKPVYWRACHSRGKLYGLVSTPAAIAMHYNRQLFERGAPALRSAGLDPARPPRTLDELDRYAEALTEIAPGGRLVRAGFIPSEPDWYLSYLWMWFDGTIFDPAAGKLTLTDPNVVRAYEWYQSYFRKYGSKTLVDMRSGFGNFDSPQNAFLAEMVAMEQQGPWMANYIEHLRPSMGRLISDDKVRELTLPIEERRKNYAWAVAPFPSAAGATPDVAYCTYDALVIPAGAKHPREAFEFIAYVNRQDVMERLCSLHCKNSPLSKVSEDFVAKHPNPYIGEFERLAAGPGAREVPDLPIWAEVGSELQNNVAQRLALMQTDAKTALAEAQARLQIRYDDFLMNQAARQKAAR